MRYRLGLVALAVFGAVVLGVVADDAERYSSKYDDVDVDEVLNTPRLRNQYVNCILGKGPCASPVAKFVKDTLPDAIATKCRRCTEKQKITFGKITDWYITNEPETWNNLIAMIVNRSIKRTQ